MHIIITYYTLHSTTNPYRIVIVIVIVVIVKVIVVKLWGVVKPIR